IMMEMISLTLTCQLIKQMMRKKKKKKQMMMMMMKKSSDQRVSTPPEYELTEEEEEDNKKGDDEDMEGEQEQDEEDDLYRDVNINLERSDAEMTNAQSNQDTEDTHVTLTTVPPVVQQQSSYVSSDLVSMLINPTPDTVAASLLKFELKKILIHKMKENKSINRSDIQKNLYNALVESYNSDKDIFSSYGDVVTLKRGRDDQDKDEDPFAGSNRGSKTRRSGKEAESSKEPTYKESKSIISLKGGSSSRKYATFITKIKAVVYGQVKWIEDKIQDCRSNQPPDYEVFWLQSSAPAAKGTRLKTPAKVTQSSKKRRPASVPKAKGLVLLSEVALYDAEQIKMATKRSKKDFHMSYVGGSGDGVDIQSKVPDEQQQKATGTNEGAGVRPKMMRKKKKKKQMMMMMMKKSSDQRVSTPPEYELTEEEEEDNKKGDDEDMEGEQEQDEEDDLSKCENKGRVPTEMELILEQTQQGISHEVSVSTEGFEE
nr:hypothetical protein [Tanacetum cinerariifolium]